MPLISTVPIDATGHQVSVHDDRIKLTTLAGDLYQWSLYHLIFVENSASLY
jgi:hypothetical protein